RILLQPTVANVTQNVIIEFPSLEEGKSSIRIILRQLSGLGEIWRKSNINFVDSLRKQLLIWQALSPEKKNNYFVKAYEELKNL
ncbi:MAG: hypothetical protein QXW94_06905, partial [Desulfurococcaceae archaeon]